MPVYETMLELLQIVAAVGAAAHLLQLGVSRGWRASVGLERLEREAAEARERLIAANETFTAVRRAADEAEDRAETLEQIGHSLSREVEKLTRRPPCFVHVLGKPGDGLHCFRATVTRDPGTGTARPRPAIWRYANLLIVHAGSRDKAREMAEHLFPEKAGYLKIFQN